MTSKILAKAGIEPKSKQRLVYVNSKNEVFQLVFLGNLIKGKLVENASNTGRTNDRAGNI